MARSQRKPKAASIHFQRVTNPALCEAHNRRAVSPEYLLPEQHRLPNLTIRDQNIMEVYQRKMALASGKARATVGYSPLEEGITHFDPSLSETELRRRAEKVVEAVEASGVKVVHAVIHMDEGSVDRDGVVHRHEHMHIVTDRTDARGRVVTRGSRADQRESMRRLQDAVAEATGLARGEDARASRRWHLTRPQLQRQGREREDHGEQIEALERQRDEARQDAAGARRRADEATAEHLGARRRAERERDSAQAAHAEALAILREVGQQYGVEIREGTKAEYDCLRAAMKSSGGATQQEYQRIRAAFRERDEARAERDTWRRRVEQAERPQSPAGADMEVDISNEEIARARGALELLATETGISLRDRTDLTRAYGDVRARWKTENAAAASIGQPKPHGQRDYFALRAAQQQMQTEIADRRAERTDRKRRRDRQRHEAREAAHDGFVIGGHGQPVQAGYRSAELAAAKEAGLRYDWDPGSRCKRYLDREGREVFRAERRRIEMVAHDAIAETAALRIADAKWGGRVQIQGSVKFRERMARLATRAGVEVMDQDHQEIVADEQGAQERAGTEIEDEEDEEQDLGR